MYLRKMIKKRKDEERYFLEKSIKKKIGEYLVKHFKNAKIEQLNAKIEKEMQMVQTSIDNIQVMQQKSMIESEKETKPK